MLDPEGRDVPVTHRQPNSRYGITDDRVYFPVNSERIGELVGRVLTQLDAMGLPERAHKAARTLLVQDIWRWWDGVYVNATTSGEGCIAPVVMNPDRKDDSEPVSNRWGWPSEQDWQTANPPTEGPVFGQRLPR